MKYFGKTLAIVCVCMFVALLVFLTGGNKRIRVGKESSKEVVYDKTIQVANKTKELQKEFPVLILYSPEDEVSVKYKDNIADTLRYLKRECESVSLIRADQMNYTKYSVVILASPHIETEMDGEMERIFSYVENGGKFFWGIVQNEFGKEFQSVYKKMGIRDYTDYIEYTQMGFEEELLPGIKGKSFGGDGFEDVCMGFQLTEEARVWAHADKNGRKIPLIWSYDYGKGQIVNYNGTAITGDYFRGIIAGCINALYDTVMYPIINAKALFIDDFPSPQYESTSDVVRKEYNRNVKDFYRDIWWPDMQRVANRHDYTYTGLFVATYNNIVEPEKFETPSFTIMQYYGNSLLRARHELGLHGYNHQSLAAEGETPKELGYKGWKDRDDMEKSIQTLSEYATMLFPGIPFETYVPPSNYLSEDGRDAIKAAMPDLKVISGVYTKEDEKGAVCCQRFEMAEDGIAEFPRVGAGMAVSDYDRLAAFSALGLHGVFSHFIHPDDIFDAERGKGLKWNELLKKFDELLEEINEASPGLRGITASEAATALKVYDEMVPWITCKENEIQGTIEQFRGEAFFYLRTDKKPVSPDETCEFKGKAREDGEAYWLVKAKKPEFTIRLEEK